MRIANLAGRLVLVTRDGTAALDVERASQGRFAADPQAVYDQWPEFTRLGGGRRPGQRAAPFAAATWARPRPRRGRCSPSG